MRKNTQFMRCYHGLKPQPTLSTLEHNSSSSGRGKNQMRGVDSPRHRYTRHPSLRFAHRGDCFFVFFYPLSASGEERVV